MSLDNPVLFLFILASQKFIQKILVAMWINSLLFKNWFGKILPSPSCLRSPNSIHLFAMLYHGSSFFTSVISTFTIHPAGSILAILISIATASILVVLFSGQNGVEVNVLLF
jgi:hypothetical protein